MSVSVCLLKKSEIINLHSNRLLELSTLLYLVHQVPWKLDNVRFFSDCSLSLYLRWQTPSQSRVCPVTRSLLLFVWLAHQRIWWVMTLLFTDLTTDWKQEWSLTRKGGFPDRASTLFSTIVHSTSSSCHYYPQIRSYSSCFTWIMMSFFRIFTANSSSDPFLSASNTFLKWFEITMGEQIIRFFSRTFPKDPFPKTIRKLNSSKPIAPSHLIELALFWLLFLKMDI